MKTVLNSIYRTFDFKGRSSRQELIFYILFLVIQSCILILSEEIKAGRILTIIGSIFRGSHTLSNIQNVLIGVLFISFIPLICLLIRRLHDINLSVLSVVIPLIILFGISVYKERLNIQANIKAESESYYDITKMEWIDKTNHSFNFVNFSIIIVIIFLLFLCLKGSDGDNKYGKYIGHY
tara:strand:- start:46 stop:585 length:540 start_codon:yes stop_codon:yes gene_type:complete